MQATSAACPFNWAQLENMRAQGALKQLTDWGQCYGMCYDKLPLQLACDLPTGATLCINFGGIDGLPPGYDVMLEWGEQGEYISWCVDNGNAPLLVDYHMEG